MAATVIIREYNGTSGGETGTDKTSGTIRFKKADNATVDNANPLVKPTTGQVDRSYEKWTRLRITGTGPTGSITAPKFYTSGSQGSGSTTYVRTTNPSSYATPAIPANDAAGTDATTYSSGSPKSIDVANAGPYTGTNTDIADLVVLWTKIDDTITAPQNPTSTITLSYQYSET